MTRDDWDDYGLPGMTGMTRDHEGRLWMTRVYRDGEE